MCTIYYFLCCHHSWFNKAAINADYRCNKCRLNYKDARGKFMYIIWYFPVVNHSLLITKFEFTSVNKEYVFILRKKWIKKRLIFRQRLQHLWMTQLKKLVKDYLKNGLHDRVIWNSNSKRNKHLGWKIWWKIHFQVVKTSTTTLIINLYMYYSIQCYNIFFLFVTQHCIGFHI